MKPTPYVVADVKQHLFLVINGQDSAVISESQSAAWIVQEGARAYVAQYRWFNSEEKHPLSIL
jgi:protein associated with RNAse G/E